MQRALALLVALAVPPAATGCDGGGAAPSDTIAKAATKTSRARTASLSVTGLIEGAGTPGRLRYAANGGSTTGGGEAAFSSNR